MSIAHETKLPEGRVSLSGFAPGKCLMISCVWEWGYIYPPKGRAIPFVRAVWTSPEQYPNPDAKAHIFVLKPSNDLYKWLKRQGIYATESKENSKLGDALL